MSLLIRTFLQLVTMNFVYKPFFSSINLSKIYKRPQDSYACPDQTRGYRTKILENWQEKNTV